jgi:cyclase
MPNRIIVGLLIKDDFLVKGNGFVNHKYLGDPINAVRIFSEKIAHEILIMDISARDKNSINFNLLKRIASRAIVPLSYSGAVDSFDSAAKLFYLGFEKIYFSTNTLRDTALIYEIANKYGNQSIGVIIDYNIESNQRFVYTNSGSQRIMSLDVYFDLINDLPIGEIVLQCINLEGSLLSGDEELMNFDFCTDKNLIFSGGISKSFLRSLPRNYSYMLSTDFIFINGNKNSILFTYYDDLQ